MQKKTSKKQVWWIRELPALKLQLLLYISRNFQFAFQEAEDLVGEGLVGLLARIKSHKKTLPSSWFLENSAIASSDKKYFYKLAFTITKYRIMDFFRKNYQMKKMALPQPVFGSDSYFENREILCFCFEKIELEPSEKKEILYIAFHLGGEKRVPLNTKERKYVERFRKNLKEEIKRRF